MRRLPWLIPWLTPLLLGCSVLASGTSAIPTNPAPPAAEALSYEAGVPVELSESLRIDSYTVSGVSAAEVRAELNRAGPVSAADGRRFDAMTSWSLRWNLRYDRGRAGCTLAGAAVFLDIVVLLPELEMPDLLPLRTRAAWDAYRQALHAHEMAHVEQQRRGAKDLQNALTDFDGVWTNCRALETELKLEGERQVAAILAADRRYDELTGHGRLEGASFP
jgi:predicted secreted Zn-dependent protease